MFTIGHRVFVVAFSYDDDSDRPYSAKVLERTVTSLDKVGEVPTVRLGDYMVLTTVPSEDYGDVKVFPDFDSAKQKLIASVQSRLATVEEEANTLRRLIADVEASEQPQD